MEGESQNSQAARVEKLWRTLDTRKEGQLSLISLKKGLRKLDHRKRQHVVPRALLTIAIALKNADALLADVLKKVDTSGDGRIQYSGTHERMTWAPVTD